MRNYSRCTFEIRIENLRKISYLILMLKKKIKRYPYKETQCREYIKTLKEVSA